MMRRPATPRPIVPSDLLAPTVARAQDGVFTRAQARAEGFTDNEQRRHLRRGRWLQLAGPVLRPEPIEVGPWQRARAVALLGRIVSHSTAGAIWGLEVDQSMHGIRSHGTHRRGIADHRPDLRPGDVTDIAGMRITAPLRTLTDLLCTWPEDAAIPLVTDALRRKLITTADLDDAARAAAGRTGVHRVRAIAESCSGAPWSWLEWRFQSSIRATGPGWRFNVQITLSDGSSFLVDALHESTGTIVELDGKRFHGADRFQADRSRDQQLTAAGYVVVRITWEDQTERLDLMMRRLTQTISARDRMVRVA